MKQLGEFQTKVKAIREAICQPLVRRESPVMPVLEPSSCIEGTSWVEEMDIRDSIQDEEVEEEAGGNCDEVCLVEVGPWTEEHIKRSFVFMTNNDRHQLRNKFALPKVAVTKTPSLDPVMAVKCSKGTKANDKVLAYLQALTLDTVRPLTDILEKLNSGESKIDADGVVYAMESAITLIGNASSQMSVL